MRRSANQLLWRREAVSTCGHTSQSAADLSLQLSDRSRGFHAAVWMYSSTWNRPSAPRNTPNSKWLGASVAGAVVHVVARSNGTLVWAQS